jgi:hypothetical protein
MITEPYKLYTKAYPNPTSGNAGYVEVAGTTEETETFTTAVLAVTVKAKANDIYVYLSSATSGDFDDPILLEASSYSGDTLSVSYNCKRIKVANVVTDGINNGYYQIIGWSDQ